jgi:hypothetical protein
MRTICYTQESTAAEYSTFDDGPRIDGFIRHFVLPKTSDTFRDYGFVDHVEIIPPS